MEPDIVMEYQIPGLSLVPAPVHLVRLMTTPIVVAAVLHYSVARGETVPR